MKRERGEGGGAPCTYPMACSGTSLSTNTIINRNIVNHQAIPGSAASTATEVMHFGEVDVLHVDVVWWTRSGRYQSSVIIYKDPTGMWVGNI